MPFSEKDQAKALGARWDAARKTWYVENIEDLTPFKRWIPDLAGWDEHEAAKKGSKPACKRPPAPTTAQKTGPVDLVQHCGCNVLPWEHCEHSRCESAPTPKEVIPIRKPAAPAPTPQAGCVRLTRELIEQHKTARGGWTRAQLQAIGVGWPPPRGWVQAAIDREISPEDFRVFTRHGGHSPGLFGDL